MSERDILNSVAPEVEEIRSLFVTTRDPRAILRRIIELKGSLEDAVLIEVYREVVDNFLISAEVFGLACATIFAEELQKLGAPDGAMLRERSLFALEQIVLADHMTANIPHGGSDFFYAKTRLLLDKLAGFASPVDEWNFDQHFRKGFYPTKRPDLGADPHYHLQVFSLGNFGPKYLNDAPNQMNVDGYFQAREAICDELLKSDENIVIPPFLINGKPMPSFDVNGLEIFGHGESTKELLRVLGEVDPFTPVTFEMSDMTVHMLGKMARMEGLFQTVEWFFGQDIPRFLCENGMIVRVGYLDVDVPRNFDPSKPISFKTTFSLIPGISMN